MGCATYAAHLHIIHQIHILKIADDLGCRHNVVAYTGYDRFFLVHSPRAKLHQRDVDNAFGEVVCSDLSYIADLHE
ncbi:hypothetical protein BMS3Abin16_01552 [archaeon BMS3Abin16]|nr:hypothetical protein BMS3Abin16_01552 [archaeon BMS3Abin16]